LAVSDRPLVSYEPNPVLGWLYQRFFEHIAVDSGWVKAVRDAEARGTVVYVLRNLSFVDFLALDYLTKRFELPRVRFANDLGLWILEPMGRGWFEALKRRKDHDDEEDLRRAMNEEASAALFLKRPARLLEGKARGKIEGDAFIRTLFEVQRTRETPILLVPQVFIWSKHHDDTSHSLLDGVLGPREWPGNIRNVAQFLLNYRSVTLRAGEPVDVKAFLEQEATNGDGHAVPDEVLVRRMTYVLLRRLERERRAVIGPAKKPADRLREEVARSPKLQKIVRDMAGQGDNERRVITWRAVGMMREMEAALDVNTVATLAKPFEQITSRMYTDIEVDEAGLDRLRTLSKEGTLILLPSHKSHVDYMVLTYIFYKRHLQLPLIAAGDNLSFFPLGPVFRRAGAFFIRRSFRGDRLYGAVVDAYVRRLIKDGWPLEFFLEGGRSRTGKLLQPKIGLLSMVVEAALGVSRPVYFCPISIGYERVVEERSLVREATGGDKQKEDIKGLFSTAELMAERYGRLNVQFGEPLTLEQVLREFDPGATRAALDSMTPARRRQVVTRLAYRVMNEINAVTAVTPGALVATALLTHRRRGVPHVELVSVCDRLGAKLHRFGARFTPSLEHPTKPARIRREAVREACELFLRAGHVTAHLPGIPADRATDRKARRRKITPADDTIYVVPDDARMSLDLSKNIVVHFFVARALIATALLTSDGEVLAEDELGGRVQTLSKLFKYEFQFRADAPFEQIFAEEIDAMVKDGELVRDGARIQSGGGAARDDLVLYARVVESFLEAYRIAARGLGALLRGPLAPKELTKRAMAQGDRMFLAGEIALREAVNGPAIDNAYLAFVDQGYLTRTDGKLELVKSYASAEALRTIEGKVTLFLGDAFRGSLRDSTRPPRLD
jgi:glycerol-3-phosphate O-acyltransferase